jgi:hypothetical protein
MVSLMAALPFPNDGCRCMSPMTDANSRLRGELVFENIGPFNAYRAANPAAAQGSGRRSQL